jgi:hypothetical protein
MVANLEVMFLWSECDFYLVLVGDGMVGVLEVLGEISGGGLVRVQDVHDLFGVLTFH